MYPPEIAHPGTPPHWLNYHRYAFCQILIIELVWRKRKGGKLFRFVTILLVEVVDLRFWNRREGICMGQRNRTVASKQAFKCSHISPLSRWNAPVCVHRKHLQRHRNNKDPKILSTNHNLLLWPLATIYRMCPSFHAKLQCLTLYDSDKIPKKNRFVMIYTGYTLMWGNRPTTPRA